MSTTTTALADNNREELTALCRMLTRAREFRLAFAVANHPSVRTRLAAVCEAACGVRPLEVTLNPDAPEGIVAQLERVVGDERPAALFVHGLESMLDLRVRQSPAMDLFNLNRDYARLRLPWPVVFVAPLFAVREFALQAPDLWSGQSGVYRFTGDRDDISETLAGLGVDYDWSLDAGAKLERREILDQLQAELAEQPGEDPRLRAELLTLLARAAAFDGDSAAQERLLTEALPIYRQIGARLGEANAVQALGDVARMQGRYAEAAERYGQALPIYRQIGDRLGEANTLRSQARLAHAIGQTERAAAEMAEAIRIYTAIGLTDRAERCRDEAAGWDARGRKPAASP